MANQQLVEYIKAQLAAGVSRADIQRAALGAKWPQQEIESAFAAAEGRAVAQAPVVLTPKPATPVVQVMQTQPQMQPVPQEKPLPVIHMHPPGEVWRSPWFWSLVSLLVVVILFAAAYFLTPVGSIIQSYFAPAPVVPEVTAPPPPTEQTYVDSTYGFSVTYPSTLLPLQAGTSSVFALLNFSVSATTSAKVIASCASTAKAATTTINGVEFGVRTATSTTMQVYNTVHTGTCFMLEVSDPGADPILRSFMFVATSTPAAASTTVQQ